MSDMENERKNIKVLRKITRQRLKNIGLYYLKRFESSVANLRSVLRRRVNDYAYHTPDFNKAEAYDWIEELLADFQRVGYLDDARFSELKIKDYLSAGKSPRYIQGKLREKGIDENMIEKLISEQEFDPFESALRLARKKHIGPFSPSAEIRAERRSKDLAILVRAGFDYDIAVRVLETAID